ncbi:MAG: UDP-glucose 4-epimerase [Paracidovorax wautersii]|uniref:UDP-glucose 4-epimerase n=1 Tax=Paracidovorax wautersii TaxID=1177982 RepID=A0A7V8FQM2_9BURK|nr:MAG: UDP-glucose 4-epimerase [Paracidovorax wautersii]
MKILVTGGRGFLGAWVLKALLEDGHAARVFDRPGDRALVRLIVGPMADAIEWHEGDIASAADVALAALGCDSAIHLAGLLTLDCRDDPLRAVDINIKGTIHVFEAARRQGWRGIAYASSAGVYGPDDASSPAPATVYGATKLACEGIARAYWGEPAAQDDGRPHRVASVGLRPFVIYGAGRESGSSAGPSLACRAIARGQPYEIAFTGATGLVYVEDVARVLVAAATQGHEGARVFNMAGDVFTTDQLLARLRALGPGAALSAAGAPLPIAADLPADDLRQLLPGYRPTPLDEGLRRTLAVYRREVGLPIPERTFYP